MPELNCFLIPTFFLLLDTKLCHYLKQPLFEMAYDSIKQNEKSRRTEVFSS